MRLTGFSLVSFRSLRRLSAAATLLVVLGMPVIAVRPALAQAAATSANKTSGRESTPAAQSPEKNQQEEDSNEAYKHSAVVTMLGSKLGLTTDQAATAFEVTNFAILAILIVWFLARALPKTFRNRTGVIQKRLVEARAATEEAGARLNSVEGRLAQLDSQIANLRSQAEKDLAKEEIRVKTVLEDERKKIMAGAEQEIAAATAGARRDIQQYAAELAVDQAAKKLVVSAETDRLLVQEFAGRLTGKRGGEN